MGNALFAHFIALTLSPVLWNNMRRHSLNVCGRILIGRSAQYAQRAQASANESFIFMQSNCIKMFRQSSCNLAVLKILPTVAFTGLCVGPFDGEKKKWKQETRGLHMSSPTYWAFSYLRMDWPVKSMARDLSLFISLSVYNICLLVGGPEEHSYDGCLCVMATHDATT